MKVDSEGKLLYQFAVMKIDLGVEDEAKRAPYVWCPALV